MIKKTRYFKILRYNGYAPMAFFNYNDYLPHKNYDGSWTPGKWLPNIHKPPYNRNLRMCRHGYHVCRADHIRSWWESGNQVYEIEFKGRGIHKEDKSCFCSIRLLRKIPLSGQRIGAMKTHVSYLWKKTEHAARYSDIQEEMEKFCLKKIDQVCNL